MLPTRGVLSPRIGAPLRGIVLSFTKEWSAFLIVLISICVISARVRIRSVGVIFVAKVESLQTNPCLPSPNLTNLNLPTPVIVERL